MSDDLLAFQIKALQLPAPVREFRFHPTRRWRFDFAWPDKMVAAEFEGGTYVQGAHTRGEHFLSDCIKYNTATAMGWRVFRFTAKLVKTGEATKLLEQVLKD